MIIKQLTQEQESLLSGYRDKWLKIGLCTDLIDIEKAKAAVRDAYQVAGLPAPKLFFKFDSPFSAALVIFLLKKTAQVRDQVGAQIYGNHDAAWLSFYDFFRQVLAIKDCKKLEPLTRLAENCGWWTPYRECAVLQERPELIKFDDTNRLHCEEGAAIRYRDGFSVWA